MVLVDLHCHLLPGIDDGSPDWATSMKLAQAAVKDGVTHALCTPHTLNGRYLNHKQDVIKLTAEFQQRLKKAAIPLTVFPGQEVRLSGSLMKALRQDDILFCDESSHYMLLEFPSEDVPSYAKQEVFSLEQRGITPVIVHPERNRRILKDPQVLQSFLEQNCLVQVTASSYTGVFGKQIQKLSARLISAGQVACLASDVHALPNRQYQLSEALSKAEDEYGPQVRKQLQTNARRIINGEPVQLDWQPLRKRHRFWLF